MFRSLYTALWLRRLTVGLLAIALCNPLTPRGACCCVRAAAAIRQLSTAAARETDEESLPPCCAARRQAERQQALVCQPPVTGSQKNCPSVTRPPCRCGWHRTHLTATTLSRLELVRSDVAVGSPSDVEPITLHGQDVVVAQRAFPALDVRERRHAQFCRWII